MRFRFTLSFIGIGLMALALMSSEDGPAVGQEKDRTGSPLASGTCANEDCHDAGMFSPDLSLSLLTLGGAVVTAYNPGENYQISAVINSVGSPAAFGLQMVVLDESEANAGSYGTPAADMHIETLAGRDYYEHSTPRPTGTFLIPWTAPAAGTGNVNVYAGGTAVNANEEDTGDGASITSLFIPEFTSTSVEDIATINGFQVLQNPVQSNIELEINAGAAQLSQLEILSIDGKRILESELSLNQGLNHESIDVNDLKRGIYILNINFEGGISSKKILIQ